MSDVQGQPTETGGPPPGQAPAVPPAEMRAASGPSGPRAGFWQRVGAQIIDSLVLAVPYIILVIAGLSIGAVYAIALVIAIAYYVTLEGGPTGQTLGKKALGIRVIDLRAGGPIGYGRAFIRFLVEAIFSANVLFLGYLWMLWDREKQTWQDKAATSVVVPVDAYPVG
jgi:uncharacterized RDD family membrane protein YckC